MNIRIHARGFDLTEGLQMHAIRRIRFALEWARHDVRIVDVRLSDLNGPRGGIDKVCQIRIPLAGQPLIVVEDVDADLYAAIDRAAGRCERTLARRMGRHREHREIRLHRDPDAFAGLSRGVAA